MIGNKLIRMLEEAGIKSKTVSLNLTPEDRRRQKEMWEFIMKKEKTHEKASKSKLVFKEYSTNTYSPFPAPKEMIFQEGYRFR